MTIQEILEAHKGMRWSDPTIGANRLCLCGHFIGAPESRTNGADHRAHVAEVLAKHMQEREAEAFAKGQASVKRGYNAFGESFDDPANPYETEPTNGR